MNGVIEKLVSVNPELADMRSKKVQRTDRSAIWSIFTGVDAEKLTDTQSVVRC